MTVSRELHGISVKKELIKKQMKNKSLKEIIGNADIEILMQYGERCMTRAKILKIYFKKVTNEPSKIK
eukprot:snap_masked-scaffold_3-processed-gene-12.37-mRNA-1 protein AED:1.00 eAED:1.00 QI:0/-1/0/0/-1/1/1/0/67